MTGVVTRDSAQRRPSDKHRSDARHYLRHRRPLVPHLADQLAVARCPILPLLRPILDQAAAAATPRLARIRRLSTAFPRRPPPKRAPQCPHSPKRGPNIERGRSARRRSGDPAPRGVLMANSAVVLRAHQIDDNAPADRDHRSVFLSAGPEMAGSALPDIGNLLDADGTVSRDRAAAPAEDPRSGLTR